MSHCSFYLFIIQTWKKAEKCIQIVISNYSFKAICVNMAGGMKKRNLKEMWGMTQTYVQWCLALQITLGFINQSQ